MNVFTRQSNRTYLIAGGLFCFIVFLLRLNIIPSFYTDIAGIEQNVVYGIQSIISHESLYNNPKTLPYAIIQYTPLYYYICGLTGRLLGIQAGDIHAIYIIGRSYNLIFNLITAWFIFKIARKIFRISFEYALMLFFLSFTFQFFQDFAIRSDSMQDVFAVAAAYLFFLFLEGKKNTRSVIRVLLPVVLLTAISTFSKQSGIQVIGILGIFCLLNKEWKTLAWLALLGILIYGAAAIFFIHHYPYFLNNVVGGIANGISIANFIKYIILKKYFLITGIPLMCYAVYQTLKTNGLFKGTLPERLLYTIVLGTLGFATLTGLKNGATVQYYLLFMNFSMILLFHNLNHKLRHETLPDGKYLRVMKYVSVYCCICMIVYMVFDARLIKQINYTARADKLRSQADTVAFWLQNRLSADQNTFFYANLTNDPTIIPARQGINNILRKQAVFPQLDVVQFSTAPLKVVGYDDFETRLQNGQIAYIVESIPSLPFQVSKNYDSLKKNNYRLFQTVGNYSIYKYQK